MKNNFASRMREKGLTARDLAEALGVTERQVWYYLAGRCLPKRGKVVLLARLIGVPIESILRMKHIGSRAAAELARKKFVAVVAEDE